MPAPAIEVEGTLWRGGEPSPAVRRVPEETAVAISYGGTTQAVMMATPADLEDFAVGFTLTEGIADDADEILAVERVDFDLGIEMRIELALDRAERLAARRRSMAGPVGCGLCGIESLEAAIRSTPMVSATATTFDPAAILDAMRSLGPLQALNVATHAVHAAAFWRPGEGVGPLREDVGRHNALDKLAGALARTGVQGSGGAVLLTSRVSVEMVQKTARIGAELIVAVSAPTALAIRTAEAAGITLVAIARADGFEVFTRKDRIDFPAPASSASRQHAGHKVAGRHVA